MLMARDGISEGSLAVKLGLSRTSMNDRLRGRSRFTLDELARIAQVFEVEPGVFFKNPRSLLSAGSESAWTRSTAGQTRWAA